MLTHCRQTLTTMFFYVKYHRNLYSNRNNEMSINPRLELVWWYPISQPARLTLFKLHVSTSKGEPSSNCAPCDIQFSNDVSIIKTQETKPTPQWWRALSRLPQRLAHQGCVSHLFILSLGTGRELHGLVVLLDQQPAQHVHFLDDQRILATPLLVVPDLVTQERTKRKKYCLNPGPVELYMKWLTNRTLAPSMSRTEFGHPWKPAQ